MHRFFGLVFLFGSLTSPVLAQPIGGCFMNEKGSPDINPDQFDANMRIIMMAHAPVEHRKSCGLSDATDSAYFDALRDELNCSDSDAYASFFSGFLEQRDDHLFAASRDEFVSIQDYDAYCDLVGQINLADAVDGVGKLNPAFFEKSAGLFQEIREIISQKKIRP